MRLLKLMILGLCIASCQSCSTATRVKVINFDNSEYFETEKEGQKFYCMSDYYVKKILNAKIEKVNPK